MTWLVPQPGLVIEYSYLWEGEPRKGREDGVKDRPCAIILVILRDGEHPIVRVLPIGSAQASRWQKPLGRVQLPARKQEQIREAPP